MAMELRHLRYFVAVVEEGSLTTAAGKRLHTSQPSLSRQIRDLEDEVGADLLLRSVHGVQLTESGQAFLDHARLALAQLPRHLRRRVLDAQERGLRQRDVRGLAARRGDWTRHGVRGERR